MSKISIITPSYNQGQFIERTINSVLNQNIPQLEYIIVDGKSQDETVSILTRYRHQLAFISEHDKGQTHAINKGLAMCGGDIIGWLNSDDVYCPGAIEKIEDFFERHPEIEVIYGKAYTIDENDNAMDLYPTNPWNFKSLKKFCYISQPAVFFRRSVFNRYGKLDESLNYCMDYEYWIRLGKANASIAYLPEVLAGSRIHPMTKTQSQAMPMQLEVIHMLKKHFDDVPARWFLTYAYAVLRAQSKFKKFNPATYIRLYAIATRAAFQHNGWCRGSLNMLQFPQLLLQLSYHKLKRFKNRRALSS